MAASQIEIDSSARKVTILLVDDDDDYRYMLNEEIQREATNVYIYQVGSGREALEFIENNVVDIIVLDYEMPGMDGTDVLVQLKQLGITKMAIGLTRIKEEPVLSKMVASCALIAFCKDDRSQFYMFLKKRIDELSTSTP